MVSVHPLSLLVILTGVLASSADAAPDAGDGEPRCKQVRLKVGAEPLGYRARGKVCDGERQGTWRFTFLDGRRLREGAYERGEETGRWRMWYRRRGRRRAEGGFVRGRRVGRWVRWHRNGKQSLEGTYKDGLRHGRWRRWHRNGALYEDRWYLEGRREGIHWRWDASGRGTLVRKCKGDVCEVLCRGWRKKPCAASAHSPVEQKMPTASPSSRSAAAP